VKEVQHFPSRLFHSALPWQPFVIATGHRCCFSSNSVVGEDPDGQGDWAGARLRVRHVQQVVYVACMAVVV
jgi:hypothetical protein